MPRSRCEGCGFVQFKEEFAQQQWTKKNKGRFCKACVAKYVARGLPLECIVCGLWKSKEPFAENWHNANTVNTQVCTDCVERRRCVKRKLPKEQDKFSKGEWEHASKPNHDRGVCRDCQLYNKQTKVCSKCKGDFPFLHHYSHFQWRLDATVRLCLSCAKPQARIVWWKCV